MSVITSDDLEAKLQDFAKNALRSELSEFAKVIREAIVHDLQESIAKSGLQAHGGFPAQQALQLARSPELCHLPGQPKDIEKAHSALPAQQTQQLAQSPELCHLPGQPSGIEEAHGGLPVQQAQQLAPSPALSNLPSQLDVDATIMDKKSSTSSVSAKKEPKHSENLEEAKRKMELMRQAIPTTPAIADELKDDFKRKENPPERVKTAKETMLRMSGSDDQPGRHAGVDTSGAMNQRTSGGGLSLRAICCFLKPNREDEQVAALRKAWEIFKATDNDNLGTITISNLSGILTNPDVKQFFSAMNLDIREAAIIFELLDYTGDGRVEIDEYLRGCLHLGRQAKALDVIVLSREVSQLFDGLYTVAKANGKALDTNQQMLTDLLHLVGGSGSCD